MDNPKDIHKILIKKAKEAQVKPKEGSGTFKLKDTEVNLSTLEDYLSKLEDKFPNVLPSTTTIEDINRKIGQQDVIKFLRILIESER